MNLIQQKIVITKSIKSKKDSKEIKDFIEKQKENLYLIDIEIRSKYINSDLINYLQKQSNENRIKISANKSICSLLKEIDKRNDCFIIKNLTNL